MPARRRAGATWRLAVGWVWAFLGLEIAAVLAGVVDVIAIRRRLGKSLPKIALGMKAAVVLAFAMWWVYFNLITQATSMEDLATFAGMLVTSVPVLAVSLVLDIMTLRALVRSRKEAAQ